MEILPVTPDRWDDLAELFTRAGPRGGTPATAGCWCMWWRRRTGDAAANRQAMEQLVRQGREPGLLAYQDGQPVGWVSLGPRDGFGQLQRSRIYRPVDQDPAVWCIVCFYVPPGWKRRGVSRALLEAALEHAVSRGAEAVEAYASEPPDYMGVRTSLEALGFRPLRPAGKRTLMRWLPPGGPARGSSPEPQRERS